MEGLRFLIDANTHLLRVKLYSPDDFVSERELYRDELIARTGAALLPYWRVIRMLGRRKGIPEQLVIYFNRYITGMRQQIAQLWRKRR